MWYLRAFMESRDLLCTFRFDDNSARKKIGYWFAGEHDSSWKADHDKCERFLDKLAGGRSELARRWSMFSALSHPTSYAASNSVRVADSWVNSRPHTCGSRIALEFKVADYLVSIDTLIVIGTIDLPEWVSLACDPARMPNVDSFHDLVTEIALPILNRTRDKSLPPGSFRE